MFQKYDVFVWWPITYLSETVLYTWVYNFTLGTFMRSGAQCAWWCDALRIYSSIWQVRVRLCDVYTSRKHSVRNICEFRQPYVIFCALHFGGEGGFWLAAKFRQCAALERGTHIIRCTQIIHTFGFTDRAWCWPPAAKHSSSLFAFKLRIRGLYDFYKLNRFL